MESNVNPVLQTNWGDNLFVKWAYNKLYPIAVYRNNEMITKQNIIIAYYPMVLNNQMITK